MTVYIDEAVIPWRGKLWAHMLATDLDELHAIAAAIGLKREWFQDKRIPHYDVTEGKRWQALRAGAVAIAMGELPDDVLRRRPDGSYGPRVRAAGSTARESPTTAPGR